MLLVFAVGAVVTVATNGLQLLLPASSLGSGWAWAVRVAGAATAAAGLAGLLAQRKRLRSGGVRGADPTIIALRTAATIMGMLALMALSSLPSRSVDEAGGEGLYGLPPAARRGGDGSGELSPPRSNGLLPPIIGQFRDVEREVEPVAQRADGALELSLVQRIGAVLSWVLLVVMAIVGLRVLTRRMKGRRDDLPEDIPLAPADAEAGLEASLGAVTGDSRDPRRQITSAYHRLLAALATAGALRQPQEAPHEHLHRALGPLGVRPQPLHRLTELYVLAQFGGRPVTEQHRAVAADSLEVSLADLRSGRRPTGSHENDHVSVDDRGSAQVSAKD